MVSRGNLRQHEATLALRRWKRIMTERAVGHHSHIVALALWDYCMFDSALFSVV